MTPHDDNTRLHHMLDHAHRAAVLARGRALEDIERDPLLPLALTRLVEVVGEAAAHVSPRFQANQPEIAWPQTMGLRNHLIDGDDEVDMARLFEIVTHDLPDLELSLLTLLPPDDAPPRTPLGG